MPANVSGGDGLVVDEDDTAMVPTSFPPGFEQRRNGPAVVGDKRQSHFGGMFQTHRIVLSQESTVLPLRHGMNDE